MIKMDSKVYVYYKRKEYGIDEYVLNPIVGHAIEDVTEKVYTHRKVKSCIGR